GPSTFQSRRVPSDSKMNAPLRVPTKTRIELMLRLAVTDGAARISRCARRLAGRAWSKGPSSARALDHPFAHRVAKGARRLPRCRRTSDRLRAPGVHRWDERRSPPGELQR